MSQITVAVTNWQNPNETRQVTEALKKQSVNPIVWVWNNNPEPYIDDNADAVFNSGVNLKSYAGILVLGGADTKYVMKMDDDILITDTRFIEKGINIIKSNPDSVCSIMGRMIPENKPYYPRKQGSAEWNVQKDYYCDMCIGQVMLMETRCLEYVPMRTLDKLVQEDLTVALRVPGKHIVPACWTNGWKNLSKPDCISSSAGHWQRREEFMEKHIDEFRKKTYR